MQKLFCTLVVAVCLLPACYKCEDAQCSNVPPVEPDYPPPATCETACAHLSELGCPEGRLVPGGTTCPTACHKAEQLIDMRLMCLVRAPDVTAVRGCGSVRCRD